MQQNTRQISLDVKLLFPSFQTLQYYRGITLSQMTYSKADHELHSLPSQGNKPIIRSFFSYLEFTKLIRQDRHRC